ncbi:MAG TPA: ferritin-like domain-containing protein, partial [Vineibacter sp.]|nr:ferritin-like domain-containing protein [Vineibacter sp.]
MSGPVGLAAQGDGASIAGQAMKNWTLDDIAWDAFDRSKVDPELLKLVKAAALVEHNGYDYATYLKNVFGDDTEFTMAIDGWAREEVQHGEALGRWAMMADPTFDFDAAFKKFTNGYKLPLDATTSVRGTRAGELMARCIVETGTSSYYSALRDAAGEPVLKQICAYIAADELRHYKLFYTHMRRWLEREHLGRWGRLRIGLARIHESEDDELAYAYFAANAAADDVYERSVYAG